VKKVMRREEALLFPCIRSRVLISSVCRKILRQSRLDVLSKLPRRLDLVNGEHHIHRLFLQRWLHWVGWWGVRDMSFGHIQGRCGLGGMFVLW
jgi:hypothetical protein